MTAALAAPGPAALTLSERLARDTHPDHDAVERLFDLPTRLSSPAAYADLLARLLALHEAAATVLPPLLPPVPVGVDRVALLRRDLADLAAAPSETPPFDALAAIAVDRATALGAAYVLEGSSLGGLVIAGEVGRRLGLGPERGAAFLHGDGRATAARWRSFTALLDRTEEVGETERTISAARATFRLFGQRLGRVAG